MANINADVLRVFDTAANIATTMRNKQIGFETTNERIAVKDASGTMHYFDKLGTTSSTDILITDNISDAFRVRESTNEYININTTDASEAITLGNALMDVTLTLLGSGTTTLGGDLVVSGSLTVSTSMAITAGSITDTGGAISFGNENLSTSGTLLVSDAVTFSKSLTVNSATSTYPQIFWKSTYDDATGPQMEFIKERANPADADYLAIINFRGDNDAAEHIAFAQITVQSSDVTDGTEDSLITINNREAGAMKTITITGGNVALPGTLGITGAVTASNTLGVTGNFAVNTNKFNVTASSGDTTIAGTLGVTGATTLTGTLNVVSDFSVNTNKLTVAAATGNTAIAGTLGVTGNSTMTGTLAVTDAVTFSKSLTINSATASYPQMIWKSTYNDTLGPQMEFVKERVAPADLDYLAIINFRGDNTAAEHIAFQQLLFQSSDVSDGTEDGIITIRNMEGGTLKEFIISGASLTCPGQIYLKDDMGLTLGTDEDVQIWFDAGPNDLYISHVSTGDIEIEQTGAGNINITATSGNFTANVSGSMQFVTTSSGITIEPAGVLALDMGGSDVSVLPGAGGNVLVFASAASGETPTLQISGYKTGDSKHTLLIGISAADNNTALFSNVATAKFDMGMQVTGWVECLGGSNHPDDQMATFGTSSDVSIGINTTGGDYFLIEANTSNSISGITIKNISTGDPIIIETDDGNIELSVNSGYIILGAPSGVIQITGAIEVIDNYDFTFGTTTGSQIGSAANQKIGFWGATPGAQYATTGTALGFTQGSGTAVYDASVFTGDTGTKGYTIGDIVRALKLAGIMAAS